MEINILSLSDGAKTAKGITVIIDVYRAFTTQSFAFENGVKDILNIATPWFVFLFVFIILLVLIFMMVGVEEKSIVWLFSENWVVWTISIIVIIGILGFAMSQVYGPVVQGLYGTEETAKEGITFDIGRILFHPRMIGMIFIMIIASQAVRLIAAKN